MDDYNLNIIKAWFDEREMNYSLDRDKGCFILGVPTRTSLGFVMCTVAAKDDKGVILQARCSIWPDKKDRATMAEAAMMVCRMNFGLVHGSFDLDLNDGELLYKVAIPPYTEAEKLGDAIGFSLSIICSMYHRYGNAIIGVLLNNDTAKEAVAYAEREEAPSLMDDMEMPDPESSESSGSDDSGDSAE